MTDENNVLEDTSKNVTEKEKKSKKNYHKNDREKNLEGEKKTHRKKTTKVIKEVKEDDGQQSEFKHGKEIFKKSSLKIIPLGGLHEVGKNITVFEYENEMIVVDCGLSFPEDDMLGVDLVIPDITYLVKNQEKLKGLVITHGHEDHIGGIPYF